MDALAKLQAIEEIKQLKARYFRTLDTQDWAGMAQVFCQDAVFDSSEGGIVRPVNGPPEGTPGPVTHGRDAIMAWISGSFTHSTCVHHGHGHEIVIDSPTEAHGVIAMMDDIRGLDRQTRFVHAMGHYTESYRFEDGAWRIAKTKLTRLFRDVLGERKR